MQGLQGYSMIFWGTLLGITASRFDEKHPIDHHQNFKDYSDTYRATPIFDNVNRMRFRVYGGGVGF